MGYYIYLFTTVLLVHLIPRVQSCEVVETLSSYNGNITSPKYPNNFIKSDCKRWKFPESDILATSYLLLQFTEMKLIHYLQDNNRKFISADLEIAGQNFATMTNSNCVILRNQLCRRPPEILDQGCITVWITNVEVGGNLTINFTPVEGVADFMTPRRFKLEYEYVPCTLEAYETPTTTQQYTSTTKESNSCPESNPHNNVPAYLPLILGIILAIETIALIIFCIWRLGSNNISSNSSIEPDEVNTTDSECNKRLESESQNRVTTSTKAYENIKINTQAEKADIYSVIHESRGNTRANTDQERHMETDNNSDSCTTVDEQCPSYIFMAPVERTTEPRKEGPIIESIFGDQEDPNSSDSVHQATEKSQDQCDDIYRFVDKQKFNEVPNPEIQDACESVGPYNLADGKVEFIDESPYDFAEIKPV